MKDLPEAYKTIEARGFPPKKPEVLKQLSPL